MANLTKKEAHERVRLFLTDILELGGQLIVRSDGKIVWADKPGEDILLGGTNETPAKILYNYSINLQDPNGIILNPINETVAVDHANRWFYSRMIKVISSMFCKVIRAIVYTAVDAKKNIEVLKDPAIAHLLSPIVNDVDEKMKNEIDLVTDPNNESNVLKIVYLTRKQESAVYTLFQDKDHEFIKSLGTKVRKKFWPLLEKVFQEVFSTENIDTEDPIYVVKAEGKYKCPKFRTFVDACTYVWKMMLPFYPLIYDNEDRVDNMTDQIARCIKNLEEFEDFCNVCTWYGTRAVLDDDRKIDKSQPRTIESAERRERSALESLGYGTRNYSYNREPERANNSGVSDWRRSLGFDGGSRFSGYLGGYQNDRRYFPEYQREQRYTDRYYDRYEPNRYHPFGFGTPQIL